jgi:hypothetical protein
MAGAGHVVGELPEQSNGESCTKKNKFWTGSSEDGLTIDHSDGIAC